MRYNKIDVRCSVQYQILSYKIHFILRNFQKLHVRFRGHHLDIDFYELLTCSLSETYNLTSQQHNKKQVRNV